MWNKTSLLAYRDNDLFRTYLPPLAIQVTKKIVFPAGTAISVIQERMQSEGPYNTIIADATVMRALPTAQPSNKIILDEVFEEVLDVETTQEKYTSSFVRLLTILNPEDKPIALVKDSLCDHLPYGDWFSTLFSCYKISPKSSAKLEHFVPRRGFRAWLESPEYKEIQRGYNSGKLSFASGYKPAPGKISHFSPWQCSNASIDLIIAFLQTECRLNARVIEHASDVKHHEFMIVDRHVTNMSRNGDVLVLPIEGELARLAVDRDEVVQLLRDRLHPYAK